MILHLGLAKYPKASETEEPQPCHDTTDTSSNQTAICPQLLPCLNARLVQQPAYGQREAWFLHLQQEKPNAGSCCLSEQQGALLRWESPALGSSGAWGEHRDGQKWCWLETPSGEMDDFET